MKMTTRFCTEILPKRGTGFLQKEGVGFQRGDVCELFERNSERRDRGLFGGIARDDFGGCGCIFVNWLQRIGSF